MKGKKCDGEDCKSEPSEEEGKITTFGGKDVQRGEGKRVKEFL